VGAGVFVLLWAGGFEGGQFEFLISKFDDIIGMVIVQ
jgi:hypothetical protein